MTSPDLSTTISVSQVYGTNGGNDYYIFTVLSHNLLDEGDYMILNFPPEVSLSNKTVCAAKLGVRGFYSCKYSSPNTMTVAFSFAGFRRRMLGSVQ